MTPVDPPDDRSLDHRDATYYRLPRRRHRFLSVFGWMAFVLVALAGATVLFAERYANYALSNPENDSVEVRNASRQLSQAPESLSDKPINILIIGSDARPGEGVASRSDTIMLFRLDFKRRFISQLSFPRDLYIPVPDIGPSKINAAYNGKGGTERVIKTVKQLTGENDIAYFFNVDFAAFRQLVNDAGGVWLDVDRHYFNDNSGGGPAFEPLNIPPGYQRLSGSDALDYVRYRHGDSDFGRIARQQTFFAELKRETRGARGLDNIVDAVHDHVTTNLKSANRLRQILQFGLEIDKDRISRTTIEGYNSSAGAESVVRTTDQQIRDAVERWRNPEFEQRAAGAAPTAKPDDLLVAVYNGSGRVNLSQTVGGILEKKGYRVFSGSNAPDDYPSTVVYYSEGREAEARALAVQFGPNATSGLKRQGMDEDMDLIVMLGKDYNGVRVPKPKPKPKAKPDTVTTLALKPIIQQFRNQTKSDALVPLKVPRGAEVVYVRTYNIERGDHGKPNALTIVFKLPGHSSKTQGNAYFTITQTSMKDPKIVETTDRVDKQGMRTWYDGKTMQRLLWKRGKMTYWITNTLSDDRALSDVTIRDMRTFMVRPGAAKLKKGQTDTPVKITVKGRTP